MGYEATCTLSYEGTSVIGRAYLEQKDLIFRGEVRLSIPLAEITSVRAAGDNLHVTFKGKPAVFTIGVASAGKWARRISNPPSRLDKLGVKAGLSIVCLALHDEQFVEELRSRGAVVSVRQRAAADIIFFGAAERRALERLPVLAASMKKDGALWVVRPKGVKTITEGDVMAGGKAAGLVDVKVVSFSDSRTAEKFVIPRSKR